MISQQRLFTAYIDLSFLRKLLRSKPDPISDSDQDWMGIWQSVFSFLRRRARVIVDGREEKVLDSEVLTHVLLSDGQPQNVEFEPGISEQIDGKNGWLGEEPFSVFFFEECDTPLRMLREKTGLLFLCHDELNSRWPRLFQSNTIDLHGDNSTFEWNDLSPHARPLNTIIIADKYAYQQLASHSNFTQNLGDLLETLLPDHTPEHPIDIAIVTGLQKAVAERYEVRDLFQTARSFLDDKFGHLDIHLRLLDFDQNQHEDRFLITNYGIFFSGDSFDYFREDGSLRKNTLVKYLPMRGHETEALRRLRRFSNINFDPPLRYVDGNRVQLAEGDPRNRLLDWVQNHVAQK
ncbi:hypothetical protein [Salinibacter ruber]|uniref:hypothetical protein n=1 Tax=Salinibacter ruber TaxID=146919 RepID=UPI0021698536|nr:hypothetical protein [Salinibacter ruber]MCS3642240.1 hypothetical protein [Salinibacter ruber]